MSQTWKAMKVTYSAKIEKSSERIQLGRVQRNELEVNRIQGAVFNETSKNALGCTIAIVNDYIDSFEGVTCEVKRKSNYNKIKDFGNRMLKHFSIFAERHSEEAPQKVTVTFTEASDLSYTQAAEFMTQELEGRTFKVTHGAKFTDLIVNREGITRMITDSIIEMESM